MADIYEINFKFQADRLTPPRRRTPKFLAYVFSLLAPMQSFNNDFCIYVRQTLISTNITGQVIVLEQVLTEALGIEVGDPRVFIQNIEIQDDFTIGAELAESSGIFSDESFADSGIASNADGISANFKVLVPDAVWTTITDAEKEEFNAIIQRYKLYGTFYIIETY